VVPWDQMAVFLVLAAAVGILAALWPARRAARMDTLSAIKAEKWERVLGEPGTGGLPGRRFRNGLPGRRFRFRLTGGAVPGGARDQEASRGGQFQVRARSGSPEVPVYRVFTARSWLTPIRLRSKDSAEATM
jgi:hypothetical protein